MMVKWYWYCLLSLYFSARPFLVGADSSDDIDLVWKTDGFVNTVNYENVDLRQSSLLAVCLAANFDNSGIDGEIKLTSKNGGDK